MKDNNNTATVVTVATVTSPEMIEAAKRRLDGRTRGKQTDPGPVVIRFSLN